MDALDARILFTLGVEPFAQWPPVVRGLKTADVARRLGRNVRLVQDRIARMEADGVIAGYGMFPNLRHFGLGLTVFHVLARDVPGDEDLARLAAVDGFVGAVSYVGSGLCLNVTHARPAQRDRRMELIARLVESPRAPLPLYERAFPPVARKLSSLDWCIIRAMQTAARRPHHEVAREVGITAKTVRTRLNAMRKEGSIDEVALLNLQRVAGIVPFEIAVWAEPGVDPEQDLLSRLGDRYLIHFRPPEDGYCDLLLRVFAYTHAEVQSMVREVSSVEGVNRAEALLAAGSHWNDAWLPELLEAEASGGALVP